MDNTRDFYSLYGSSILSRRTKVISIKKSLTIKDKLAIMCSYSDQQGARMNVYTHRVTYLKFSEILKMNVEVTFRTTADMVAQHRAEAKKLAVADTVVIEQIED